VLTENDVVKAVARHLRNGGYRVDKELSTRERGVDIDAVHSATGRRLLVEAKGATSSKVATARFGKGFTRNQDRTHVSVGLYCVAKLQQQHSAQGARVALAFPNDLSHRRLVDDIRAAVDVLGITIFFVDGARKVTTLRRVARPSRPTRQ
jgi:hypothetical protein